MKKNQKSSVGQKGETLACEYLMEKGMKIVERNCRTRFGEIDIIASSGDIFVFVEVKTKSSKFYGNPEEMINQKKRQKLIRLAHSYLQSKEIQDPLFRIDIISVMIEGEKTEIKHFENAIEEN